MHVAAFSARTYLLSLSPPPPPPLFSLPPSNAITGQPACTLISDPPPPPPQEDYGQILASSPKVEDGLHLGVCEYGS
jgi:hypothetical protein